MRQKTQQQKINSKAAASWKTLFRELNEIYIYKWNNETKKCITTKYYIHKQILYEKKILNCDQQTKIIWFCRRKKAMNDFVV